MTKRVLLSDADFSAVIMALAHAASWVGKVQGEEHERAIHDLIAHIKKAPDEPEGVTASVAPGLPADVAARMQEYGERNPDMFQDLEERFFAVAEGEGFASWERDWYDPATQKVYHSFLKLEVEETENPDWERCPMCGDDVDWGDAAVGRCTCGWSVEVKDGR